MVIYQTIEVLEHMFTLWTLIFNGKILELMKNNYGTMLKKWYYAEKYGTLIHFGKNYGTIVNYS